MQNNRHTNMAMSALNTTTTTTTTDAGTDAGASTGTEQALPITHSKRPDIEEIVRSLYALGRSDVADRITSMTGVVHKPLKQGVGTKSPTELASTDDTAQALAPKQKYLRGRYRFAYIYVNSASASLDEQTKMLAAFLKAAKSLAKTCPYTAGILAGNYEVVPITLPRNFVTLSIRVNMDALKRSKLLDFAEKYQTMKVYFRKPRKDTQHLAEQLQQHKSVTNV